MSLFYPPYDGLKKRPTLRLVLFIPALWRFKKNSPTFVELFLYPQAVLNRCCGNENPES